MRLCRLTGPRVRAGPGFSIWARLMPLYKPDPHVPPSPPSLPLYRDMSGMGRGMTWPHMQPGPGRGGWGNSLGCPTRFLYLKKHTNLVFNSIPYAACCAPSNQMGSQAETLQSRHFCFTLAGSVCWEQN